jgi:hypothetical protein
MSLRSKAGSLIGKLGKVVSGQTEDRPWIPDVEVSYGLVTYGREAAQAMMEDWDRDYRYRDKSVRLAAAALPRPHLESFPPYMKYRRDTLSSLKEQGIVGEDAKLVDD